MKKLFFLMIAAVLCFVLPAGAQNVQSAEIESEYEIDALDEDVEIVFTYAVKVNVASSFNRDKNRWMLRLEDPGDGTPFCDKQVDVYYLKLDDDCKITDKLEFKISGHKLTFVLQKKS